MNLIRPESRSDATVQRSVLEHTFANDERTADLANERQAKKKDKEIDRMRLTRRARLLENAKPKAAATGCGEIVHNSFRIKDYSSNRT